jgi:Ca2+-binding EF-hand superfamily protein
VATLASSRQTNSWTSIVPNNIVCNHDGLTVDFGELQFAVTNQNSTLTMASSSNNVSVYNYTDNITVVYGGHNIASTAPGKLTIEVAVSGHEIRNKHIEVQDNNVYTKLTWITKFTDGSEKEEIIEKLRNIISKRGSRGIMSIRREFMIADSENNKRININAFKKFCHDYRIDLADNEINLLFAELDLNKDGTIDYQEFLKGVIGEMNERRKRIIQQAFKAIDKNGIGLVELDDIRENYNAKMHPDVLSGKKTEEEVLAEFLDTFEYQFSLLSDEKENESKISMEEFLDYYNNISLGIKDDSFFEEMIKNVYNLDSRKNNKKIW